jgi:GNAT superfamily N-acetyltransferase
MPWPYDDKPLAYRASMLPIGNYEDGSIAFPVWPQGALDLFSSGQQFNNAAEAARGIPHTSEESFPRPQDVGLASLPMMMTGFPGLGRAVSGKALQQAERSSGLPSVSFRGGVDSFGRGNYEALVGDTPVGRAYARDLGENIQLGQLNIDAPYQRQGIGTALQKHIEADMGKTAVPDTYLSNAEYQRWKKTAPQIVSNYKQTDSGSWMGTPSSGLPSVKSPLDGSSLFSNAPDAAPAGLLATGDGQEQPDFMLELLRRHGFIR